MYIIVSPVKLKKLKEYKIPTSDKYGTLDLDTFYSTPEGKEFSSIAPFTISRRESKKSASISLESDISYFSLCYNCTLYIYLIKDEWFHKNLLLPLHSNIGNVAKLNHYDSTTDAELVTKENKKYKVDSDSTYYNGVYDEISKSVNAAIKKVDLTAEPVWSFELTAENGLVLIKENC